MATLIQKWKASDNSEWNSEADADARDEMIRSVNDAMSPLGPRDSRVERGDGYFQHSEVALTRAKLALYEIAKAGPLKWLIDDQINIHGKTDADMALRVHVSWFGRMLDGGCDPLERAYARLYCIDDQFREWQQPYYAINPGTGKQVRVN